MYFAQICFEKFGDRVKYWATINEPGLFVNRAYIWGTYPPGHCSRPFGNCSSGNSDMEPFIAMHNMLLSHSMAVHLYRKQYQVTFKGLISKFISDVSKNSLLFSAMFAFFLFSFFKSFLLTINDSFILNYLRLTLKHNLFQFIIENCFKL